MDKLARGYILQVLHAKRMSEYELARKAGIHYGTLSRIILGATKSPGMETVERIAKGLGVPVSSFLPPEHGRGRRYVTWDEPHLFRQYTELEGGVSERIMITKGLPPYLQHPDMVRSWAVGDMYPRFHVDMPMESYLGIRQVASASTMSARQASGYRHIVLGQVDLFDRHYNPEWIAFTRYALREYEHHDRGATILILLPPRDFAKLERLVSALLRSIGMYIPWSSLSVYDTVHAYLGHGLDATFITEPRDLILVRESVLAAIQQVLPHFRAELGEYNDLSLRFLHGLLSREAPRLRGGQGESRSDSLTSAFAPR